MRTIRITLEGGTVMSVEGIPAGVKVEIWDFDTDGVPNSDLVISEQGEKYILEVHQSEERDFRPFADRKGSY